MHSLYFSQNKNLVEKVYLKPSLQNSTLRGFNLPGSDYFVKQSARLQFGSTLTLNRDEISAREEKIAMVIQIIREEIKLLEEQGRSTVWLGNLLLLVATYDDIADEIIRRFPEEVEKLRSLIHQNIAKGEIEDHKRICKELIFKSRYNHSDIFMARALETPEMKAFLQECRQRRKGKAPVLVVVGSGPVPFTAIQAAIRGMEVICLERDWEAFLASKKLHKLISFDPNLAPIRKRIKIFYRDGINFDYSKADLVYVVPILSPEDQRKIFERICQCHHAEHKRVMTVLAHHVLL
jgi:hypothetical protein